MAKQDRKKADRPSGRAIPVRFPDAAIKKIDDAMRSSGLSQAEVIRIATQVGLVDLSRIGHNIPKAIYDAARRAENTP